MKKQWGTLSRGGIWIVATTSTFLFPPPGDISGPDTSIVKFVTFAIAVMVGLLTLAFRAYKQKKHANIWAGLSAVSLIAGSVLYFVYNDTASRQSVGYDGKRIAAGTEYTQVAAEYRRTRPAMTDADLVQFSGGQPALVWTADSIRASARSMALQYCAAVVVLAMSLLAAVQALECSQVKASKPRK
ncbi:MAG TPA: hypothetical protein VES20_01825 [Bryobacteraceae bacterium]|nr:hypothetical protein [Bryobacteraceae bacterium]